MTIKKKNHRFKENLVKISIKYFIKKPSFIGLFILVLCFGIYYFDYNNIPNIFNNFQSSEIISNNVRVVDGDSIVIDNIKVRLQGIDAPELKQRCNNKVTHKLYACGEGSKSYLITLINYNTVKCLKEGIDRYNRVLAYCYVGEINLNKEMVSSGNAVAYRKYDPSFIEYEEQARGNKIGIWASEFEEPEKWRNKKK